MSYGTPLEKKSCANYGTPLNQGKKIHTKKVLKEPNLIERAGPIKPVDISKAIGKLPPIKHFKTIKTSIPYDGKTPKQIRKEQSASANYGSPLDQKAVDLGIVKSNYKGKERKLPFPGKEMYEGTGDFGKYKGKYTPEMLEMNRTYTQKYNEANVPGYTEIKRRQVEMENRMTKEEKARDDY
jgi:hypothetical protein